MSLAGKFLVANPYTNFNDVFSKSVIYVLAHNSNGAMGFIINNLIKKTNSSEIFTCDDIELQVDIFFGGFNEINKGFIIHSQDYNKSKVHHIDQNILVSSNQEIMRDIQHNVGPKNYIFAIGNTIWEPNQMEQEMFDNNWLISDYNEKIMFMEYPEKKWESAIESLGLDEKFLYSRSVKA